MHRLAHPALIICLIAALLNLPAVFAAKKPIGMVITASNAHLDQANVSLGTNVFPGDYLDTDPGGTLRLKIASTQIYLASSSAAMVVQNQNKVWLKLTRGTTGFSSASEAFQIETPVGLVHSANPSAAAFGEVTLVGPHQIMVAAYRGALVVSGSGFERTIKEGDAFNVNFLPNADPSSPPQGPAGAGTNNDDSANSGGNQKGGGYPIHTNNGVVVFSAVFLGAAALGGYAIWHAANESDATPH